MIISLWEELEGDSLQVWVSFFVRSGGSSPHERCQITQCHNFKKIKNFKVFLTIHFCIFVF